MTQPPAESPFLPGTHIQFAWDSTSLGLYKECARKYLYTMIRGFRPKGESVHLTFGIWYHSALECYDKRRALGDSHETATRVALLKVMTDSWVDGAPWESDHALKTRPNLIRSIIWYLDEFEYDKAQTVILANGQAAVELSFRFRVSDDLVLSGHLDRLVNWMDGTYVMDRKTSTTTLSSYYFDQYEPDNQMSLYTLAGRLVYNTPVRGVVIDAAQIAVGFTRFDRGLTYRSEAQLEEWLDATQTITYQQAEMAEKYSSFLADGHRYPERAFPQNDKSCQKFGGCSFRRICSKSPEVRETFLQNDFEVRHWNPLASR